MKNIQVIGGWIEFNGFRVAKKSDSVPASIWSDFVEYVGRAEQAAYDRGRKEGYDEGFKEGEAADWAKSVAALR